MDVFRSALSLVIHKNGHVSGEDVDDLIDRYRVKKGITLDKDKYWQAVRAATEHYQRQQYCLFVCTDSRCLAKTFLNPSNSSMQALSHELNCPVEVTGCHWQCDDAPVLTLKVGSQSYSFPDCSSAESWQSARESILRHLEQRGRQARQGPILARKYPAQTQPALRSVSTG